MGLRTTPVPELMVKVSDSVGFAVRGLSPHGVYGLYRRHAGALGGLYDAFIAAGMAKGKGINLDDATLGVGIELLSGMPILLSEIIALGAGTSSEDPEFEAEAAHARSFSIGVQTDALTKIASLTFTSEMPPKKFLAVVQQLAAGTTASLKGRT